MQNRRPLLATSHQVVWALFLAAFVAIGAREVWIGTQGNFISSGQFSSTDAYLHALLEVPNGTERCTQLMRALTGSRIIYFCSRRDPKGDFTYGLLTYLSLPQPVEKVEIDGPELNQRIASVDRTSPCALMFYGLVAPAGMKGWQLGPHLFIVPVEAAK